MNTACMDMCLASASAIEQISFIFGNQVFVYHRPVLCEYEYPRSKNKGPSDWRQNGNGSNDVD
jgi:hypothetical protein